MKMIDQITLDAPAVGLQWLWAALAALGLLQGAGRAAPYVDVVAEITVSTFHPKRGNPSEFISNSRSYTVRCVFGTSEWWLTSDFVKGAKETYYCDGVNTFLLIEPAGETSGAPPLRLLKQFGIEKTNISGKEQYVFGTDIIDFAPGYPAVKVIPGLCSLGNLGANIPWLAFCSSAYLNLPERLIPLPGIEIRRTSYAFGFRDEIVRFPDLGLGLPKELSLYADKGLIARSHDDERLMRNFGSNGIVRVTPFPVQDGALMCHYEVLEVVRVMGWDIPREFRMVQHFPESDLQLRRPRYVIHGEVHSMELAERLPEFTLIAGMKYRVVDHRFRSRHKLLDGISYTITNGVIPGVEDGMLKSIYRQRVAVALPDRRVAAGRLPFWIICVLLLPAFGALAAWRSSRGSTD